MKPKPRTKPNRSQYQTIGRLIILHDRASNMAEQMKLMHESLVSLAFEINEVREDLRIQIERK